MLQGLPMEDRERYKKEKSSLIGFQGSFTKKLKVWREAVDGWQAEPLSALAWDMAVELRATAKEAQDRLDRALYSIIAFSIVVEAYQIFMEEVEDKFQGCNAIYTQLCMEFERQLVAQEEKVVRKAKEDMEDRMKEQDHTYQMEANRADRQQRILQAETEMICERAAAEALARADPAAPPTGPPLGPARAVHAPAADPPRLYKEVQSLHPGSLCLENTPEELRAFEINFRNWYQISCLDTLGATQQIFTLKKCCSLQLQQKVNWEILATIDAALAALMAIWEVEYPYITRRLEFLRNKQLPSENMEDFVLRARQLFVNGDIARMMVVQLQIINIISGLRDSKLQIKLLELPVGTTLQTWMLHGEHTRLTIQHHQNWAGSSGNDSHKAQRVGNESICWRCGQNWHFQFD